MSKKDYDSLKDTFEQAVIRASKGKGLERHATDKPFEEQAIVTEGEILGILPHIYQIRKKALEILRMDNTRGMLETLDIINYAAAMYIILKKERENGLL